MNGESESIHYAKLRSNGLRKVGTDVGITYTPTGRTIEEAMKRLEAEAAELNLSKPHSFHHAFAHERDSFPGTARTKGGSLCGTDGSRG